MWALRSLSPKDPLFFCIRLPQEATFCFNFIDKLIIFAIFASFFLQIPAFKALTEISKVTFSSNAPSFFEIVFSPNGSASFTPVHPFDIGVPPGQISSFAGLEWLKISFLSQIFNTNQNLSGFWQILSFAGLLSGEKCQFWAKFSTWIKISGFCQVSSFEDPECSKMLILSQIFKATQNFWI